ncbi:MAG: galactokinase [Polyangiales bacterium]
MSDKSADGVVASAPGRVNLIGEHTDYNDGFVLPMPIPQQTRVELWPQSDKNVEVESGTQEGLGRYVIGSEVRTGTWLDYVQGVTAVLGAQQQSLRGFVARIRSDVPMGAGLSSSAALEIALLRALREAFDLSLDDLTLARLGQQAEVEFVGAPTGIMDQMASSLGVPGSALFIDTRTLETRTVELPPDLELVVIASGVTHAHGTGGYRTRRAECTRAAQALGVASLREVQPAHLVDANLDPLLLRRARHVVSENARVLATLDALAASDLPALAALFAASHASMRDDYEVSVPEIDTLVELGVENPSIIGARLTGGGFGGSVVMLARRGRGFRAAVKIVHDYQRITGREATILLPLGGETHA